MNLSMFVKQQTRQVLINTAHNIVDSAWALTHIPRKARKSIKTGLQIIEQHQSHLTFQEVRWQAVDSVLLGHLITDNPYHQEPFRSVWIEGYIDAVHQHDIVSDSAADSYAVGEPKSSNPYDDWSVMQRVWNHAWQSARDGTFEMIWDMPILDRTISHGSSNLFKL